MPEGANPLWFWLTKAAHRRLYLDLGMSVSSVELEWRVQWDDLEASPGEHCRLFWDYEHSGEQDAIWTAFVGRSLF